MPNKWTIRISNDSSDDNFERTYCVYPEPPAVSGGGASQAVPLLCHVSELHNGAGDSFRIHSKLYGFVGRYEGERTLTTGNVIILNDKREVQLGTKGDGQRLLVQPTSFQSKALRITPHDKQADSGTFSITCASNIAYPEPYVVGLAREFNNRDFRPVAAVQCVRDAEFIFRPALPTSLYISRFEGNQNYDVGAVVTEHGNPAARFEISHDQNITIKENSEGLFEGPRIQNLGGSGQRPAPRPTQRTGASPVVSPSPASSPFPSPPTAQPARAWPSENKHFMSSGPSLAPAFIFGCPPPDFSSQQAPAYRFAPAYPYGPRIAFIRFSSGGSWVGI